MVELELDGVVMNVGEASDFDMKMEDDLPDMDAMGPNLFDFKVNSLLLILLLYFWKNMREVVDDLCIDCYNRVAHSDYILSYKTIKID